MSLRTILLNATLRWQQHEAMRLSPAERLARNRELLAVDHSKVPATVAVERSQLGGVPLEWVIPKALAQGSNTADVPVCLYFHGGGFAMGSPQSHRDMASYLALKAGLRMAMIDYRLAPEHPFPAALDDGLAVYRALAQTPAMAGRLAVGGDSAGGNLALAVLQQARDEGLAVARAMFFFSPWLDLHNQSASMQRNAPLDVFLNQQILDECRAWYAGGHPLADPRVSPLGGDVSRLPPCFLVASACEVLLDDALGLRAQLEAAGIGCTWRLHPSLPHAYPALARLLPEARTTLKEVATFLQHQLA